MTNHWVDFKNSDVILIMGSNPASNHPVSWKWIQEAVNTRNAKIICVDPRFTQSASKAHLYAPLRSGTDIAFLGGMIKYILDNNLYFEEYVRNYTNASFLVNPAFKMPGDNKGVFSGLTNGKYEKDTWSYQTDGAGVIRKDPTMEHPNCVFQLLKKHYSRYTPEIVSKICGTPVEKLIEVYKLYGSTGKPDRAGVDQVPRQHRPADEVACPLLLDLLGQTSGQRLFDAIGTRLESGLQLPAPTYAYYCPGGAGRYVQGAQGYDFTVVYGQVFMDHGEHTGVFAGALLKNGAAT